MDVEKLKKLITEAFEKERKGRIMSGTKVGGLKCSQTNKERYGEDYYKNLGKRGGKAEHKKPRWFQLHPELARKAGAIGGMRSKRGKAKKSVE